MPVFTLAPAAAAAFWGSVGAGASAGAGIYGAHAQGKAADKASAIQSKSANYAADLEAKAAADALKFQQEQEAQRKAEFAKTQALNLDQWTQQRARLAPFLSAGTRSLSQLANVPNASAGAPLVPGRMTVANMGGY